MHKRSSNGVTVYWIDEAEVRRAVDEYAATVLRERPDVDEIVVFGSFVNGNYAPGSDIDLFIILSKSDQSVRDRIPDLLPRDRFPVPVDIFPYTREEMRDLTPSLLLEAVADSTWRYSAAEPAAAP